MPWGIKRKGGACPELVTAAAMGFCFSMMVSELEMMQRADVEFSHGEQGGWLLSASYSRGHTSRGKVCTERCAQVGRAYSRYNGPKLG